MSDFQAVAREVISNFEFSEPKPPLSPVLTASDLPADIPLTNRLDKMTPEQAIWAIKNGDAWLSYLKENGGEVLTGIPASDISVTDAEKKTTVLATLTRVNAKITDKHGNVATEHLSTWRETLEWALEMMPECFASMRRFLSGELADAKRT